MVVAVAAAAAVDCTALTHKPDFAGLCHLSWVEERGKKKENDKEKTFQMTTFYRQQAHSKPSAPDRNRNSNSHTRQSHDLQMDCK